jgi:hypothetical protein
MICQLLIPLRSPCVDMERVFDTYTFVQIQKQKPGSFVCLLNVIKLTLVMLCKTILLVRECSLIPISSKPGSRKWCLSQSFKLKLANIQ